MPCDEGLSVTDFNVGIASAIASYARLRLHGLMTAIRKVGGTLIYCDTDSIICDIDLNDYPEIKKEFQWDGNATELGRLKNECNDMVEKKLKKLYPDVDPVTKIELSGKKNKTFSYTLVA